MTKAEIGLLRDACEEIVKNELAKKYPNAFGMEAALQRADAFMLEGASVAGGDAVDVLSSIVTARREYGLFFKELHAFMTPLVSELIINATH